MSDTPNKVFFGSDTTVIPDARVALEYLTQWSEVLAFGSPNGGRAKGRCHRGVFADHYYRVRVAASPYEIEAEAILPSADKALALMVAVAEGTDFIVTRAQELLVEYAALLEALRAEWEVTP